MTLNNVCCYYRTTEGKAQVGKQRKLEGSSNCVQ